MNESPVGSQSRELARTAVRVESPLSRAELRECFPVFETGLFCTAFRKDSILVIERDPRSAELIVENTQRKTASPSSPSDAASLFTVSPQKVHSGKVRGVVRLDYCAFCGRECPKGMQVRFIEIALLGQQIFPHRIPSFPPQYTPLPPRMQG